MCPFRNDATAVSLATFKTAKAVPPALRASYAKRIQGNLSKFGFSKFKMHYLSNIIT